MKAEFDFINDIRLKFPAPEGIVGIGDDCALIPQESGLDTLVSTDMLMEGVHFLRDEISPYQLGWKSAASNFSDIAAMGGDPLGSFLALSLPRNLPQGWEDGFMSGFSEISSLYAFPLLGGDTTSSPDRICVCVTVLGKAPQGRPRLRSMAVEGQLVCVTGTLGDSAAGLEAVLKGLPRCGAVPRLIERHYLPRPRISEGTALASFFGLGAMMDISDGIASDLRHIMEESAVGMDIDRNSIPLSAELKDFCSHFGYDPLHFAIAGGEDYELLFTVDSRYEASLPVEHSVIGVVNASGKLTWNGNEGDYEGFRHF